MARLTAATRNALPDSAFAGPNRTYPVQDASHARNALSRGAQNASGPLLSKIRSKVSRKYPGIAVSGPKGQALSNLAKGKR